MRGGPEPPVGSSGRDFIGFCVPTQLSPDKGLAVFNRSAHSARPAMNDGKWKIGDGKWEMGNGSLANFWFHDGMYKMWFV